jgi:hypothetical protein
MDENKSYKYILKVMDSCINLKQLDNCLNMVRAHFLVFRDEIDMDILFTYYRLKSQKM